MSETPRAISGLGDIAAAYDVLLIDQFGVLHDGHKPYPGVVDCLTRAAALGKRSIVLTNSGKRAAPNAERLVRLGFPRTAFASVVSSGEVGWHAIRDGTFGAPFLHGARVHVIGRQGDDYGLDGISLEPTDMPETAECLLILGSDVPRTSLDVYRAQLAAAAAAGIPALCANPDRQMITEHGLAPAPGAIAAVYEELGGKVTYVGKPHAAIYRYALASAPEAPRDRVLAIGDSVEHDIAGATALGITTLLIRGGILADKSDAELAALYAQHAATPAYIAPSLIW